MSNKCLKCFLFVLFSMKTKGRKCQLRPVSGSHQDIAEWQGKDNLFKFYFTLHLLSISK